MNYERLSVLLLDAVQRLEKRVADLEGRPPVKPYVRFFRSLEQPRKVYSTEARAFIPDTDTQYLDWLKNNGASTLFTTDGAMFARISKFDPSAVPAPYLTTSR